MISLFLSRKNTSYKYMIEHNGDIIIKNPIKAIVKVKRNGIWYLTVEFRDDDLLGNRITDESIFKVRMNYGLDELFRCIYPKFNKKNKTWTCYCNHVFFDVQKEASAFDFTTGENNEPGTGKNWIQAVEILNSKIQQSQCRFPYKIYAKGSYEFDENYQPLNWKGFNILECMQGSTDNSMINRYPFAKNHLVCAMFHDYDCYFGGVPQQMPSELHPNDLVITDRYLTSSTSLITMKDVVTGIIPEDAEGNMLPNNEIVKGKLWDFYEIHRIAHKKYNDIKASEDQPQNLEPVYAKLREQARKDLEYEFNQRPTKETEIDVVDILIENEQYGNIKLNDTVYVYDKDNGREAYCIDSLTYDISSQLIKDIELLRN